MRYASLSLAIALAFTAQTAWAEGDANLEKASALYYRAKERGLASLKCEVRPAWDLLLRDAPPENKSAAIKLLEQIVFTVMTGPDVETKVTHTTPVTDNPEVQKGLAEIYGGTEQMLGGFFSTYSVFMFASPMPSSSTPHEMVQDGDEWKLTYKDGDADVRDKLDGKFKLRDVQVTTSTFKSTLQPAFVESDDGYLLAGYQADYDEPAKPEAKTQLQARIEHQNVDGILIPKRLNLSGTYGPTPFVTELSFSGCSVTKR